MRKLSLVILSIMLAASLPACGRTDSQAGGNSAARTPEAQKDGTTNNTEENNQAESSQTGNSNILIAYFTVPEDVEASGNDTVAGASIVVKDNERMGNTEYVAGIVQKTTGGDLFKIETKDAYPLEHDTLVDQAADEQDKNLRPELSGHIEDIGKYDTIILGYPNWWADLPMPVYSFLEEYDFSGKTIIPFVTHGGSGFSSTISTISELQPDADISSNTLSLPRQDVADGEEETREWAESLGLGTSS